MGELLGKEDGGDRAGTQAAGVASSIFDGGLKGDAGSASVSPPGPASSPHGRGPARSRLLRAPSAAALSVVGAGGLPVFDSVSYEVMSSIAPETVVNASVETRSGAPRHLSMTAAGLLSAAQDPEMVSIRVTGVPDGPTPASPIGLSKFKDGWIEQLPPGPGVVETVVTFASGESVRGAGSRAMLLELAAHDEVVSLEYGEGPLWMRRVSQVPHAERLAGYDRASVLASMLGPGIVSTAQEAGIAGMRIHHGTLASFEESVRAGPRNLGKGFGGRGLYVAVDGDRSVAEFFASKAAMESRSHLQHNPEVSAAPGPVKALVMDGTVNPSQPLRVGRFQVKRDAVSADLRLGILPADWDRDPSLAAMMERQFDVLDLRGMRSGGLAIETDRFLVFHERAGADAIIWDGGPGAPNHAFKPLTAGEIIVDANIAIALEHKAHGDLLRPEHIAFVRRVGDRVARQPERAFTETRWGEPNAVVPIRTKRSAPEYRAVIAALDAAVVGRPKGASDREIVADAFFAATADGAPAVFYSGDKGIYNNLARIAGHDPAKLGKTVPEAFPDGFKVTVEGRTILVVPVASR